MVALPMLLRRGRLGVVPRRFARHTVFTGSLLAATLFSVASFAQSTVEQMDAPPPPTDQAIIDDKEFDSTIPSLNTPLESIDEWQKRQDVDDQNVQMTPQPTLVDLDLETPLPTLTEFDVEPLRDTDRGNESVLTLRYAYRIDGLSVIENDALVDQMRKRFKGLSVLEDGDGKAANGAMVAARMDEDQELLLRILEGEGFYDAKLTNVVEPSEPDKKPVTAVLTVAPGPRYKLGSIAFEATTVEPADLMNRNFVPKIGDPIVADVMLAAEANLSIALPNTGYPFVKIGQRDILLDPVTQSGDYTLSLETGPRSRFGYIITEGNIAFDAKHIEVMKRFKKGDLYDARQLEDLRGALVATGLLSTVAVEPQRSGTISDDGSEFANLLVRQEAGPKRSLAASAGYETGQGARLEGSWTHRNLFPPEGALVLNGVGGTQEQELGAIFRRANAGKRDKSVELGLFTLHSNFDAFEAFTGRLAGRISYDSTPIWQKRFTYAYGFELLGTNEQQYDFAASRRSRRTYYVAALPAQAGFDTSNSLLDPSKGFRLHAKVSPEVSLGAGSQIYVRTTVEGAAYYPFGDSVVVAGRVRVASISGADRENIAPSRRFYGGGGGSVRGFGYQQLGPRDPENNPIGGLSLNEAAIEARYRFGNYGVVAFVDAGQVYESALPRFTDWRFGVGIGARFYTNFGPLRLDVATPLKRRAGESRVAVYVSIGQAF